MSEWKKCKLGELTIDGRGYYGIGAPAVDYNKDYFTYLRITDINDDGTLNKENLKSVSEDNASDYLLSPNDIVFARTGNSTGRSYFYDGLDGKLIYAGFLIKFSLDPDKVNPKFLKYYTHSQSYYDWIQSVDNGATRGNINAQTYAQMPIELPSREEQDIWVSILSSLDDKIDLLHRQNATLEKMAETLFRQWFVEEAEEGWEEIPITNLFDVRDGTHDSPKEKVYGKKLITSKHLFSNQIDFGKAYYISIEDFEEINRRSKVDTYDILFSMIGTIGIIYLEQNQEVDYAIKNIGLFKTSQNPKWMYFLYLWLKSDFGQDFIHEHRSGSTQEYISLGSLRSIKLKIKSKEQLAKFNDSVEPFFKKIKTNQSQIRTLTQLRDTLLPKLMSGEVSVAM